MDGGNTQIDVQEFAFGIALFFMLSGGLIIIVILRLSKIVSDRNKIIKEKDSIIVVQEKDINIKDQVINIQKEIIEYQPKTFLPNHDN
jgi:hypothetical protein